MNAHPLPDEDHKLLTSWLAVIGMLIMYWTPVERHIDQCVHFLYRQQATHKKAKKKPVKFSGKLDFIKQNMPDGIIDAQELESLTKLTTTTVKIRDVCVHGVLNSYNQQQIEIGKIDGKNEEHLIESFVIDRSRLDRSASALSVLQKRWDSIATALHNIDKEQ